MNLQIAAMTTAKNATYVRNWSDERCLTHIRAGLLPETGLDEEDEERPGEVDRHQAGEDDPRARVRLGRVADVPGVAVPGERARGSLSSRLGAHPYTFSMLRRDVALMRPPPPSLR